MTLTRKRAPAPTLSGYQITELLAFEAGWWPGCGRGRWSTWPEYLEDFARVRPALLAKLPPFLRVVPLFGDCALAYRKRHGPRALEAATFAAIRAEGPDPRFTESLRPAP